MEKGAGHVTNMNVVALEVPLKDNEIFVGGCSVHKIIDQQINPHAGRHAEDGG